MPINNSAEMYGITRSKNKSGKPCWQVRVSRREMTFCKSFSDLTWDSVENALAAAKRYRDTMLQRVPPLTMREHVQTIRVNNTSGIAGVQSVRRPSGTQVWIARIQLPGGKTISNLFRNVYMAHGHANWRFRLGKRC